MPNRPVRQHYVPESLLQNFCTGDRKIYVFDKSNQRTRYDTLGNIASERYFYDFPSPTDPQLMENLFSALETRQISFLRHLQRKINNVRNLPKIRAYDVAILSEEQKKDLSVVVAVQFLRTKLLRNINIEIRAINQPLLRISLENDVNNFLEDIGIEGEIKNSLLSYALQQYDMEAIIEKNAESLIHARFILQNYEEFAKKLRDFIWIIGVNVNRVPVYTSDHPVVRRAHLNSHGLFSEGSEIIFPLDSELILLMFEPKFYQRFTHRDCKLMELNPDEINQYNSLQVVESYRSVFCNSDSFDLARNICLQNPELHTIERARINVIRHSENKNEDT